MENRAMKNSRMERMAGSLGLTLILTLAASESHAVGRTLIANEVPNLTTVDALTVPSGQTFTLRNVVISNPNATLVTSQRIFRSGTAVTAFITVPAGASFQADFTPGIVYTAGQVVQVRIGQSSGTTDFTVSGNLQ